MHSFLYRKCVYWKVDPFGHKISSESRYRKNDDIIQILLIDDAMNDVIVVNHSPSTIFIPSSLILI